MLMVCSTYLRDVLDILAETSRIAFADRELCRAHFREQLELLASRDLLIEQDLSVEQIMVLFEADGKI